MAPGFPRAIFIFAVKRREINAAINEVVQGKFEGARSQLLLEINDHHSGLGIAVFFEVWHCKKSLKRYRDFIKKRRNFRVLLQLQRRAKRQFLSCSFVEYFCAAKPQNCDLKTVQGA